MANLINLTEFINNWWNSVKNTKSDADHNHDGRYLQEHQNLDNWWSSSLENKITDVNTSRTLKVQDHLNNKTNLGYYSANDTSVAKNTYDTPWGYGNSSYPFVVQNIRLQNKTAPIQILYLYNSSNSVPQLYIRRQHWDNGTWSNWVLIPNKIEQDSAISSQATTTLNSAKSYTDSQATTTLNSAKSYTESYTDPKISETKTYASQQATAALNSAKTYASSQATTALNSAKTYASQQATTALNSAKSYTDGEISDHSHITKTWTWTGTTDNTSNGISHMVNAGPTDNNSTKNRIQPKSSITFTRIDDLVLVEYSIKSYSSIEKVNDAFSTIYLVNYLSAEFTPTQSNKYFDIPPHESWAAPLRLQITTAAENNQSETLGQVSITPFDTKVIATYGSFIYNISTNSYRF